MRGKEFGAGVRETDAGADDRYEDIGEGLGLGRKVKKVSSRGRGGRAWREDDPLLPATASSKPLIRKVCLFLYLLGQI
ncbi:hypothetical protein ACH5RR_002519 [Cinchona calisaya]|uniref:Uncharacterized protein n=1 Tax=Cinchona calisaya TaxID=153742 RepID=A0ABD3B6G7_9GENT